MSSNSEPSCEKAVERYWRCPNCKNTVSSAESVPHSNDEKSVEQCYRCPICKMLFSSTEDIPSSRHIGKDKKVQYTLEAQVHKMDKKLRVSGVLMGLSGFLLLVTLSLLSLVGILLIIVGLYFMS
jgi:uncharacterized C2H2 Zn-finger protein